MNRVKRTFLDKIYPKYFLPNYKTVSKEISYILGDTYYKAQCDENKFDTA